MKDVKASVELDEPQYKQVVLTMNGEFYRLLIGTLRSHASYAHKPGIAGHAVVGSGTAEGVLHDIEAAVKAGQIVD